MIGLQIDGKWAVLDEDVSISIEEQSPVWGEGNSYSFPFELSVEENRHIIGNSDQLTGQSVYDVLHGRSAVLYVQGIPFFYGKISIEDEIEIADGRIELNLVSGNKTFEDMIDGMNCQDVPLMDEIVVGEGIDYVKLQDTFTFEVRTVYYPEEMMHMEVDGVSTVNVSNSYPVAKYCNTRICYQMPEQPTETSMASKYYPTKEAKYREEMKLGDYGQYVVLEADRPLSGLCFFVLYFLDCLFTKLNLVYDLSSLSTIEDMNRLSFFSTKCSCILKDSLETFSKVEDVQKIVPSYFQFGDGGFRKKQYHKCLYVADSKNFPDTDVSDVIEALEGGFGVRFLHNTRTNTMKCIYVKDILQGKEVKEIFVGDIYEAVKVENNIRGFELKYSSGDDDDTSFNYSEWKQINTDLSYLDIRKEVAANNHTLYIDNATGNAYRVKVDEEAETESELNPHLFEVAQFNPVQYGNCESENNTESVEIPFTPIIQNDVLNTDGKQTFATFLDIEMQYPGFVPMTTYDLWWEDAGGDVAFEYSYFSAQRSSSSGDTKTVLGIGDSPLRRETDNSLFDYDAGLTFGIMRGPGNDAGVEEFDENYDNEGNVKYVQVPSDYAFNSDTIDNYGNVFDYNGEESGGVDIQGRFSLKLKGEKPVPDSYKELSMTYEELYASMKEWEISDEVINETWNEYVNNVEHYSKYGYFPITNSYAQKRGLFDKFYTEYAYFVTHRKIVKLTLRMELADLVGIDWTKRYKVGQYVGFINKVSYSVGQDGLGDVEMEMYYV